MSLILNIQIWKNTDVQIVIGHLLEFMLHEFGYVQIPSPQMIKQCWSESWSSAQEIWELKPSLTFVWLVECFQSECPATDFKQIHFPRLTVPMDSIPALL